MTTVINPPGSMFLVEERSDTMPNGVITVPMAPGDIVTIARTVAGSGKFAGHLFIANPLAADLTYAIANGVVQQTIAPASSNGVPTAAGLVKWSGRKVLCKVDGTGTPILAGDPLMIVAGTSRALVKATTTKRIVAIALADSALANQIYCIFKGHFSGFGTLT